MANKGVLTGRLRTYAYGVVGTTLFIVLAIAESLTESFISAHSRTAGTIVAVAIIIAVALAFRPFNRWVDETIESVFTRRRREARAALTRLRKELTSFNDVQQVLRRVVEAIDHNMGTDGSAIYLRHGSYDVEASTFDVAVTCVEPGDALVIRLRSSAAPADPRALGSAALGKLAFAMMAGGDLIGFLTLAPKHVEIDAEDRHALAELAEAAGIALLALDARLRAQDTRVHSTRPNNLPRQSTSFVGRQDEVSAVCELVRHNPLVTIAGAGGMGKTRLALQVATTLLGETNEGAWFVDLAPIGDGRLIASAVLSVLGADQSGDADPLDRVVKFLAPRALLLVLDNSEHLVADTARVVDAIVKQCPNVNVLATSREPLGNSAEVVHRLTSLDDPSAMQLFAERARAVNDRFEITNTNRATVAEICSHLGGIALAIELAAARARSISVEELSRRLQLRVLAGGREPLPRHQTMHALIDWSYDLLSQREQRLFMQLSPFVGGVSLDTAMATYCCDDVDDLELLDLVTSLVDKSLLVADVGEATQRYRFLEPIREYAQERLEKSGDAGDTLVRYARTFADFADAAYEEFDTGPKDDWLERNQSELDNVRASLRWALNNDGGPEIAARIAGSFGVVFLRLSLLQEGIQWGQRVLTSDADLTSAVEARLQYVLSMLRNNQGHFADALAAARRALDQYETAGDSRGIVRALSQVAQQLENNGRQSEALVTGDEAIDAARRLGDGGVLASVLGRCANALGSAHIEEARARYAEAAQLFEDQGRLAERSRVTYWWADAEFKAGNLRKAAELIEIALSNAQADVKITARLMAAPVYWALNDCERATGATREALSLAREAGDPLYIAYALSWAAMLPIETNSEDAARLLGYAERERERLKWAGDDLEQTVWGDANRKMRETLGQDRFDKLRAEGASWNQERALLVASAY
ncbi:MAG TPA: GAF domain-containing protein [Candidatus Baltobacteraceae bacterium]|nr:GAF domain-containing protein [Candidatus Baltobacteraceae bacterium]